ncbi:hypothetical protein [Candidatus Alkanophaga liquidiphilum]|nr:hypothetical protein [Candidatus Alkanophaga liquidiphilum]RLG36894.1 MAG: hypothetical protein DRN91_06830 [Candidatus Alkanophagales archaeon]
MEKKLTEDVKLYRSLECFYHALFLGAVIDVPRRNEHRMHLLSDVLLNLHKSVLVLLRDLKDEERRRIYGADYELWERKIRELTCLRDSWSLPHYEMEGELEKLQKKVFEALDATRRLMMRYVEFVKK